MSDQGALLTGVVAKLQWGYYDAAKVEGYSARREKQTKFWRLRARVVPGTVNAFNLRQKPLRFIAPYVVPAKDGKKPEQLQWEWLVEDADLSNGILTARLEPLGSF